VNFTYPYSVLKATNVFGTQEILRLASHIRIKPIHFISSVAVFSSPAYAQRGVIYEQDLPDCSEGLHSGYAESKWVAEQLAMIARARGLPVSIYRPGGVAGDSRSGVCSTDDLIWRMIKGCIQLGSAPAMDGIVDITPADYVSQAIVRLATDAETIGKVFHLVNPHPIRWPELLDLVCSFGYTLSQVAYRDWHARLTEVSAGPLTNAMQSLLTMLPEYTATVAAPARQADTPRFDCRETLEGLRSASIVCPHTDAELLSKYLLYFIRTGFLSPPPVAGDSAHSPERPPQAAAPR
jgi:thioester reductase-like protein